MSAAPSSHVREIVVVGGGIAGCSIALELARRGAGVVLMEMDSIAGAASGKNAGLLLNQIESEVVRMMQHSLVKYRELSDAGFTFGLQQRDQLLLASDAEQLKSAQARADAMRGIGVQVEAVSEQQLREFHQLRHGMAGGFLLRNAWAVDPLAATVAVAESAREAGVEIRVGTRVSQLVTRSGRVEGLITDAGRFAIDSVVLATGPWLPELLPGAPVNGGRGWLMRTGRLTFPLPWIVEEMSWPDQDELGRAARPVTLSEVAAGGFDQPVAKAFVLAPQPAGDALLGTSLAPSLRDAVEGIDMPQQLAQRAIAVAPGMADVSLTAAWSALRPMTPDGMPMAGMTSFRDLYVHGGHGSIGMMTAPAIAGWLADLVCGGDSPHQLAGLDPARFGSN